MSIYLLVAILSLAACSISVLGLTSCYLFRRHIRSSGATIKRSIAARVHPISGRSVIGVYEIERFGLTKRISFTHEAWKPWRISPTIEELKREFSQPS